MMKQRCRFPLLAFLLLAVVLVTVSSTQAQEPSGYQLLAAAQEAMSAAIEQSEKSVVSIARVRAEVRQPLFPPRRDPLEALRGDDSSDPRDPEFIPNEFATGVVVDEKGLILTNYHVLDETQGSKYYVTTSDRKVYEVVRVVQGSKRFDLAVLQISGLGSEKLTPIKFGNSGKLRKGHFVLALGNPYAIARDGQASVSWGIVSNLYRKAPPTPSEDVRTRKPTLHHFGTLIQTDARLNLGTSGGALLNLRGEMVGLTTALAAHSGYEQGAGYAIAVDDAFRRVVDQLKQGKEAEFGLLGITPGNLRRQEIGDGKHGAVVQAVHPGTPAARVDLRIGDVITQVNDQPVHDADGLILGVGKLAVGGQARLTVNRRGREFQVLVQDLAKFPVEDEKFITPPPLWRGMRVDHSSLVSLVRRDEYVPAERCVAVIAVDPDTPAWQSGLRPGMVITHVESEPVTEPDKFYEAVKDRTGLIRVRVGGSEGLREPIRKIAPPEDS